MAEMPRRCLELGPLTATWSINLELGAPAPTLVRQKQASAMRRRKRSASPVPSVRSWSARAATERVSSVDS
jgi:hypothetical protein